MWEILILSKYETMAIRMSVCWLTDIHEINSSHNQLIQTIYKCLVLDKWTNSDSIKFYNEINDTCKVIWK